MSVPNAATVSRRRARSSRANGTTGSRSARPSPTSSTGPVRTEPSAGTVVNATAALTSPATGIDTASPCRPVTASPTRWVSRM